MPTIGIRKRILDQYLGHKYSEEEFDKICFDFGIELDDVVCEPFTVDGKTKEEEVYKIELPANRCDLWSVEGLTKALKIFLGKIAIPKYQIVEPKHMPMGGRRHKLTINAEVLQVRPYCVAAILRNVTFTDESYANFIEFQDKLHQNLCRKRSLCAIGTHDLDTIQGPFTYRARPPTEIVFKPLNQTKQFNAEELMEMYSTDSHLRHYLHIIRDKPVYPVIYDSNGVVLSMPPIINGDHSKITLDTKNVFVECTATILNKAIITLDMICTAFSQYCKDQYCIEPVDVVQIDGSVIAYPVLATRNELVSIDTVNTTVGVKLQPEEMVALLTKMSLESEVTEDGKHLQVKVPPTRHDIIQQADVIEDVAIAYGYNNIERHVADFGVAANQFPLAKLTDLLRAEMAAAGFTEVCAFSLCSRDDIATHLRNPDGIKDAVHIGNPKTQEFQVCRTTLLSGILRTVEYNNHMPLPLKLFEIQDVVLKDDTKDVGARNERRLCLLHCGKTSGFEIVHGMLDRIMQLLAVKYDNAAKDGYCIRGKDDPTYFPGRCAAVIGPANQEIGVLGVLHPEVVQAFELSLPCSALEIKIELFL